MSAPVRFEAERDGAPALVAVEDLGADRFRIRIGERVLELDAREAEAGRYSVLHGDEALEVAVGDAGDEAVRVELRGHVYALKLHDPRRRRRAGTAAAKAGDNAGHITAPMPGKVVKLLVEPGQAVQAGQGVVVVEAMKMENELRASHEGTVREVRVAVGQAVELREVLVVIE